MQEHVFVEEYRKEMLKTGYPFSRIDPLVTDTEYELPFGVIVDASVYFESVARIPETDSYRETGLGSFLFSLRYVCDY